MQGTVALINADDGVVAIKTEHGEYSILGVLEDDALAVGDVISGDLEQLDYQVMENTTRGTQISVYVEDTELSLEDARLKLD
ncbi:hypothetical protein HC341_05570 [Aquisalimonas sp. 2447]|uniref:hypothetical protein n=1 Tax=Aquisalimonas sp. 2447 TaxID=2740807 RepID=UPI0014324DAE|nr:hypothetical protein [Aquisalimonas sp. 2447]QIT54732.1 hypothetical protein HC341_05570 [Aquisalimonas sp. 2447]